MSSGSFTRRQGLDLKICLILLCVIPTALLSSPLKKLDLNMATGVLRKEFVYSPGVGIESSRLFKFSYGLVIHPDEYSSRFIIASTHKLSPMLAFSLTKDYEFSHTEIGVDLTYDLNRRWSLEAQLTYAIPLHRDFKEHFIGLAFINWAFLRFDDADKDGILDEVDNCPDTPQGADVDKNGCGIDSDGDGVFDGIDKCDETPFAALVDSFGCPFDSDSDGIFDGVDICPGTPSGLLVDTLGCPLDEDADGIPDFQDSCKGTPMGAIVDNKGCSKDTDYDGVPDGLDKCPYTPTGFKVNSEGCPKYLPIEFEVIYDPLNNFGKLKPSLYKKLDFLALRIRAYPERVIELGGYTDSEGSSPYNKGRARKMVTAVKNYLISKGVSIKNLELTFYGEVSFVASNSTPEGRAKNRRVECKFVKMRKDIK